MVSGPNKENKNHPKKILLTFTHSHVIPNTFPWKKNEILDGNVQDFAFQLKMHRVNVNALGMTSKWTDNSIF